MMRIAIGDVHGRNAWKRYIDRDFTEFYILGDYFDSFSVPFTWQYRNFRELCAAAREDSRIKLCLGNHDYHYLSRIDPDERYSGFQDRHYRAINELLEQNMDLLRVIYVTADKYLISHAGVSNTFMEKMKARGVEGIERIDPAFIQDRTILGFDGFDQYGDDPSQSPIWIRPASLSVDPLPDYNQIIGHTQMERIKIITVGDIRLSCIDTGNRMSLYEF
ncbi:MAG: metallophosphoesterase [Treponema sp.]|jgi:hypothetical protein|nr:metallophosphoesterase [Treponema sp.]